MTKIIKLRPSVKKMYFEDILKLVNQNMKMNCENYIQK